ncbi:MAG: hypothetical protein ACK5QH_01400 [Rubrivivax sp.]
MPRIPVLDEASMLSAELQIPLRAQQAGQAAHQRAVGSHATILVMKAPSGELVARQTSGQIKVLKSLPAATPVLAGTVYKRVAKRAFKADSR